MIYLFTLLIISLHSLEHKSQALRFLIYFVNWYILRKKYSALKK